VVSISAPTDWSGSEILYFEATDSYNRTASNNLTVTVIAREVISVIEYRYLTTTRTVTKTRTRTITEPRFLELLAPKHLTTFSEDTVVAPIVVKNNGEAVLNDVTLLSQASSKDVRVWLEKTNFVSIAPGDTFETNLFMKWTGNIAEFDVVVNASSMDPEYTDSAVISVTGVARIDTNRSIEENNIEFVRDLLANNPECLELTELLTEAEASLKAGDPVKARDTLNFIIDGCRYLVLTRKEIEMPGPIKQRDSDLYKLISGILLLLLFITTIIIIAISRRQRKGGYRD
jgi:hypothetical protein